MKPKLKDLYKLSDGWFDEVYAYFDGKKVIDATIDDKVIDMYGDYNVIEIHSLYDGGIAYTIELGEKDLEFAKHRGLIEKHPVLIAYERKYSDGDEYVNARMKDREALLSAIHDAILKYETGKRSSLCAEELQAQILTILKRKGF